MLLKVLDLTSFEGVAVARASFLPLSHLARFSAVFSLGRQC